MAKRKKRRKNARRRNLSTGAWVAIGLGIGIGIPAVIAGAIAIYGLKKVSDMSEDFAQSEPSEIPDWAQQQTQYDAEGRPIPPIPGGL